MCELCPVPRPSDPARRGGPDPAAVDAHRPQGVWPHLSGVRGDLSLVPLPARHAAAGRASSSDAADDDDDGLRLVLRGDVTRQVLQWSSVLGPDVLARVRVVCSADLTHLDDAGRALLVDLVRVAHREGRHLHLPVPSAVATSVLARLGLLAAVDTGPHPWSPRGADDDSDLPSTS